VFQEIERIANARAEHTLPRRARLGVLAGAFAGAAFLCALAVAIAFHSPLKSPVQHAAVPSATTARSFLNRAAAALPGNHSVVRLTYIQWTGSPTRAQREYIWLAAVPGGYHVASSSSADGSSNVAAVRLKGRLRVLTRPVPVLGILDGPGDARMLGAVLRGTPHRVQVLRLRHETALQPPAGGGVPLNVGGLGTYEVRLYVGSPTSDAGRGKGSWVRFYYDPRNAELLGAAGNGWAAKLSGRQALPFFQAPQSIRQILRPDISASAPAY
jgi:hypothetical protein